ncbi:MAG: tetratricopeptide repeat protein [Candidatus Eiseniibacteriota bacterium]
MTVRRPGARGVLLAGIPVLLGVGLLVRAAVGPGPSFGLRLNRSIEQLDEGRAAEALAGLESLLAEYPDRPEAWLRAGRALRVLGRTEDAALSFRRAAELDPGSETAHFEAARAWMEAGAVDLAEAAVDETIALEEDHAAALYLKAVITARRGDAEQSASWLGRSFDAGLSTPDRFRSDPRFDPVRNDVRFLDAVLRRRTPGTFLGE